MKRSFLAVLLWGWLPLLLTTCAGSRALNGVVVTPTNPSTPAGTKVQFTASGYFNDQSINDITQEVTWTSSDPAVATIDSKGLATAISAGSVVITATSSEGSSFTASGSSGTTILIVTPGILSSIAITPASSSIPAGVNQQFTATGIYSDGTSYDLTGLVTWSSSNPAAATIGTGGLVAAVAPGTTTITAISGSISGSTPLTVNSAVLSSLAVTPANEDFPAGISLQFSAAGTYSDGKTYDLTSQVTWSSSNPAAATINSQGLVSTVAPGTATIAAVSGGISGSTTLTVNSAVLSSISLTPADPSIPAGVTQQFTAMGAYSDGTISDITRQVTWSSSNPTVATITTTGLAATLATGTTTIAASLGTVSASTALTVTSATLSYIIVSQTPPRPTIAIGATQQFKATGVYSDGTSYDLTAQVTWTSSNTAAATIASGGLATGVAAGVVAISATSGTVVGGATLDVTAS